METGALAAAGDDRPAITTRDLGAPSFPMPIRDDTPVEMRTCGTCGTDVPSTRLICRCGVPLDATLSDAKKARRTTPGGFDPAATERSVLREYRASNARALIGMLAGIALNIGILVATAEPAISIDAAATGYLIFFAIGLAASVLTYIAACAAWIGFDQPLWPSILRLGIALSLSSVILLTPIFLGVLFFALAFAVLSQALLDLDGYDGWMLGSAVAFELMIVAFLLV